MASLAVDGLHKRYGDTVALAGIDLALSDGAVTTVVGPSGCGKTTLLRCVAGLTAPDAGRVLIDGVDVTTTPPERRRLGVVFADYALFPHLTVAENVRFGLRMARELSVSAQREKVAATLRTVRLEGFAERRPAELSGGQRQRVALARAVAHDPRVLLLDEPLSAVDAPLREELQWQLIELHRRLGLTTVLVTHDQTEALTMADEVVLMRDGAIEQIGAPDQIYRRPRTRFAAEFLGRANLLDGVAGPDGVRLPDGSSVPAPADARGSGAIVLRPEQLRLGAERAGDHDAGLPVEVRARAYRGADVSYLVGHGTQELRVLARAVDPPLEPGPAVVSWRSREAHWIPTLSDGP